MIINSAPIAEYSRAHGGALLFSKRWPAVATVIIMALGQFSFALPKLAIVLDDAGNSLADCRQAVAIKYPLTIAVMPAQPYSRQCAKIVRESGQQLLIHFPWENLGRRAAREYPIRVEKNMTTANIELMLQKALASVPSANGINNHMGSVLSQDPRALKIFMAQMSRHKGLYFLDSRTSKHSRAYAFARAYGIRTTRNNAFLDGVQNELYIERQFQQAIREAERYGAAVAIGHVNRQVTRRVLKNLMTKYNTRVEYVFLPEIIKTREMAYAH